MRNAFIDELTNQAGKDDRIFLVVGDLGFSVVEPFAEQFPDRFLNAGVAEQNMTGVAAGLAMAGYKVFTYSIANFPTLRCLEQIRNDVCYHDLDVTVVAVGGGLGYGSLGYSHHAVQDIACLRGFPGMRLLLPGSPDQVRAVTEWKLASPGPAYLRLGKGGEPNVGDPLSGNVVGVVRVSEGAGKSALLAVGGTLGWAGPVAQASGASVYSLPVWEDSLGVIASLIDMVSAFERVVVCEEHLLAGGVGSLVRECLEHRPELQERVRCLALGREACGMVGNSEHIRRQSGLDDDALLRAFVGV